jgi:hypothetical protein
MTTESLRCPLYDGSAQSDARSGGEYLHVACQDVCQNDCLIAVAAVRVLNQRRKTDSREAVRAIVLRRVSDDRIHVLAWNPPAAASPVDRRPGILAARIGAYAAAPASPKPRSALSFANNM